MTAKCTGEQAAFLLLLWEKENHTEHGEILLSALKSRCKYLLLTIDILILLHCPNWVAASSGTVGCEEENLAIRYRKQH